MSKKLERFHQYFEKYEKLVLKNVNNHVHRHQAEEIAQETFLKLFENLDHLEDAQIKPWLLIVSSNIAKDYGKKGGDAEIFSLNDEEHILFIEENYESPEKQIDKLVNEKAVHQLLGTALEVLYAKNPIWYHIIVYSCMMKMSSKEIAKTLNMSPGNVDVMKIRARRFLRKKLGKEYREII